MFLHLTYVSSQPSSSLFDHFNHGKRTPMLFILLFQVSEMFDVSRSEVRKSVEQATWMAPELQNFALEKVMLKCLKFLSSGLFFTCTVLTFKCIVSVRICQFGLQHYTNIQCGIEGCFKVCRGLAYVVTSSGMALFYVSQLYLSSVCQLCLLTYGTCKILYLPFPHKPFLLLGLRYPNILYHSVASQNTERVCVSLIYLNVY